MATILIVDDQPTNREYLVTLLGYGEHRLLQALDGAQGLEVVRAERPDLVIADILMPNMDGYEFVRRLRAEPAIAATPVIFCTAHYHEREAQALAAACGVSHLLTKPCEPEVVLRTVGAALEAGPVPLPSLPVEFDRDHLSLLTDKLSEKAGELKRVNERLTPLVDLGLDLGSERDPSRLLQSFCHRAREVIGARYAVVAVLNGEGRPLRHCITSGLDPATAGHLASIDPGQGVLGTLLVERGCCRLVNPGGDAGQLGLSSAFPTFHSLLAASLVSPTRIYGWLCLLDKLGGDDFSPEDERLASIVAAQVGRIYENGSLYADVLRHAAELEREVGERKRAEQALRESEEQVRLLLNSTGEAIYGIDLAGRCTFCNDACLRLLGYGDVRDLLGKDMHRLVHHTRRDGMPYPVEECPIVRTVRQGAGTHAENEVLWRADGSSFPAEYWSYPMRRGERVVGAVVTFLDISERRRVEEELRTLNAALENAVEGIARLDTRVRYLAVNRAYAAMLGYQPEELVGLDWQSTVHPRDLERVRATHQCMLSEGRAEVEVLAVRKDRSVFWAQIVMVKANEDQGQWRGHYCFMKDVSNRKQAEQALEQYAARLQALSRQLVQVQEEERRHLARELHDEIGQVLATVNFHLHAARGLAGPAALPRLDECATLLQQAGEQLRSLALELRPTMLDVLGLEAALRWLAERHQQRTGCAVQVVGHLSGPAPPPDLAIACFRVAQEALTNVVRHASARHVWIELSQGDSLLELVVRDDGVGFDVPATQQQAARCGNFGLLGMAERVQLLGGRLDVESQPGHGTRIRASFPLTPRSDDPPDPEE